MDVTVVRTRLAEIHRRIGAVSNPSAVRIVAVTKGFGVDAVQAAVAVGLTDVGENYADEFETKHQAGDSQAARSGMCRWHFLGRVQRNKIARLAGSVDVWQGVDRIEVGREIARRSPGACVFLQVNLTGDPQRVGCTFGEAPELIDALRALDIDVTGVSGVGLRGEPEQTRLAFRRLARLGSNAGLPDCSMGMTDDFDVAVEEGSTMIRIGRGLFGVRLDKHQPRIGSRG